jgi:hypothetical protein
MGKKETYTSMDLCERYGVCLRTIRAWEKKRGFPQGGPFSKVIIWSMAKVHAWEKVHMPHLHNGSHVADDDEDWQRMKRGEIEAAMPPRTKKRVERRAR